MKHRTLLLIAGIVLVFLGLACSASADDDGAASTTGVETDSGNSENPPPADINDDLFCQEDAVGPLASGTLTNHSSELSGYMISVGFLDAAGTRVAEGTAFVNGVQPDQTTTWEARAFSQTTFATCEIVSVERLAQ